MSGIGLAEQKITAKWVETRLKDEGAVRTYAGNVAFRDSAASLQIQADSAIVKDSQYVFLSNLLFQDSIRTIRAHQLTYDDQTQQAQFTGGVLLKDGQRSLRAQNISAWPDSELVVAWQNAAFAYRDQSQQVWAHKLRYHTRNDRGRAIGNVIAMLLGEQGDTLKIQTDSLHFAPGQEQWGFNGPTKILQSGMVLSAHAGHYREDRLKTGGNPEIVWVQPNRADSVWATADTVDMSLKNHVLHTIHLIRETRIDLVGIQDSLSYVQTVAGDSAVIHVLNDRISTLEVFRQMRMNFVKEDMKMQIAGDSVRVWFEGGQLDSMVVQGHGEGVYEAQGKGISRIAGQKKILWFEKDALVKMRVIDNAVCSYTSLEGDENKNVDVGGEVLELNFEDGELTHIDARGKVRGVYMQKKMEKLP